MNKQTEALKLALEGLEKWHFDKDPRGAADYITAIREALAEQPPCKTGSQCTSKCQQCEQPTQDELERFAALVAAAERNILAAWMIQFGFATGHGDTMEQLVDALGSEIVDRIEIEIDAAVAAEREACAKACEAYWQIDGTDTALAFAATVRARGQT